MIRHATRFFVLAAMLLGLATPPALAAPRIAEGQGYARLPASHKTADPAKVEILVFFGYQCPHCYHLYNDELRPWINKLPSDVQLRLSPVIWSDDVGPSTRGLHAAQIMGKELELHNKLFKAYQDQTHDLSSPEAVADFAAECCAIDRRKFLDTSLSDVVEDRLEQDEEILREYRITRTPTVIVNGKYAISPGELPAKVKVVDVIQHLVAAERKGMPQK